MYFKECLLNLSNIFRDFFFSSAGNLSYSMYSHSGLRLNIALTLFKSMILILVFEESK